VFWRADPGQIKSLLRDISPSAESSEIHHKTHEQGSTYTNKPAAPQDPTRLPEAFEKSRHPPALSFPGQRFTGMPRIKMQPTHRIHSVSSERMLTADTDEISNGNKRKNK